MNYNQLVAAFQTATAAGATGSYFEQFEHGYVVGLNDGGKSYPILLLEPMESRYEKQSGERKIYPVKLYGFALSEGFTKTERDAAWQNIENAIDAILALVFANEAITVSGMPRHDRVEDEERALFNDRCAWIETTLELKVWEC